MEKLGTHFVYAIQYTINQHYHVSQNSQLNHAKINLDYKVRYTGVKTSSRNVNERRHIENDEYSCPCSMTPEYVPFCYNFVDVILTYKKSHVFNISVQKWSIFGSKDTI